MAKTPQSPESPPAAEPNASPSGDAAASSTASAGATSGPFIGDPGPAHDAEAAEPEQAELHVLDGGRIPPAEWEEDRVRAILTAKGEVLHTFVGVGDDDWRYTENDLRAIAAPLTKILNRYDATRAAAHTGDELALMIGMGGYIGRSVRERRDVIRELQAMEPEPASGVGAPEGSPTGPDLPTVHHETPEEASTWSPT